MLLLFVLLDKASPAVSPVYGQHQPKTNDIQYNSENAGVTPLLSKGNKKPQVISTSSE